MDGDATETTVTGSETTGSPETAGTGSETGEERTAQPGSPQPSTAAGSNEGTQGTIAASETATEGTRRDNPVNGSESGDRVANEVLTRQRDKAIREAHAYKAMLAAHNIDLSVVTSDALERIRIVEGEASGAFDYVAPGFEPQRRSASAVDTRQTGQALTAESIKQMSTQEINSNWEAVKGVLAAQRSK